jgi:excisionase family DNA binding protein
MKIITTAEAARRLGVTPNRVRALIQAKRLKAFKYGREWLIDPQDLEAVKDRKVGRPRKVVKRRVTRKSN